MIFTGITNVYRPLRNDTVRMWVLTTAFVFTTMWMLKQYCPFWQSRFHFANIVLLKIGVLLEDGRLVIKALRNGRDFWAHSVIKEI